jgi:hypothetical protein
MLGNHQVQVLCTGSSVSSVGSNTIYLEYSNLYNCRDYTTCDAIQRVLLVLFLHPIPASHPYPDTRSCDLRTLTSVTLST